MFEILIVIMPLFLIIFGGAVVQYWKNLDEHWPRVLNSFALNIGLPALIFSSLSKISFAGQDDIVLANSLFLLFSFALVYILHKTLNLKEKTFKTLFICLAFGNIAYLGPPVLAQIYGASILPDVSLIIGVHMFWLFTIGLGFLDYSIRSQQSLVAKLFHKKNKQNIIKQIALDLSRNPLLISIVLGLLVAVSGLRLPGLITSTIDMLAVSVSPVVLVVIGLFIGSSKIGRLNEWLPVLAFSIVTLLLLPGIFYLGLKIFVSDMSKYTPSMIEIAMPLAITPFALADKFALDKKFIARAIALSTILSIITIPIWASVL